MAAAKEKADVVMKDAAATEEPAEKTGPELSLVIITDIKNNIAAIEKTVATSEARFLLRTLRRNNNIRRKLNTHILRAVIEYAFPPQHPRKTELLGYLEHVPTTMDVEASTAAAQAAAGPTDSASKPAEPPRNDIVPEVEAYLQLLVTLFLLDNSQRELVVACSTSLVKRLQGLSHRRTLQPLSAKAFFYYSRAYELAGRLSEIRPTLLAAYRTATLRHDDEGQATLLNLLLRNYLAYNLYDQADKLSSKVSFREDVISSNQAARYLYYQGRIKAIQLDYSEAHNFLSQAGRKAPQTSGMGFRLAVTKLATIVQLLMGEIPERTTYTRERRMRRHLAPYYELARAVRIGDLSAFQAVVNRHGEKVFRLDGTLTLILRLRHNVIKTGLRKISLSYSRISLADVQAKLHLDSAEDAEYIVAKAIRDRVIDAEIDHEGGFVRSRENPDVYNTNEPQTAFGQRIAYFLRIHEESVKALRFPAEVMKLQQEESDEARKERQREEQDLIKSLEEEDDDMDGGL